jgi:hypothetical protein
MKDGTSSQKTNIIHTRECHIRRADLQWDKPIAKTPKQGWHNHKKYHYYRMRSNQNVI